MKARLLLATARSEEALQEYQRVADLGSGRARCIVAYAYLLGSPQTPRDLAISRELASSALSSDPGFANYILAHLYLAEGKIKAGMQCFSLSAKTGFAPALTDATQLLADRYCQEDNTASEAEKGYIRAIKMGHIPAIAFLGVFYLRGARGQLKRIVGALLYLIGTIALYVAWRLCIFSVHGFYYNARDRELFKNSRQVYP